MMLKRYSGSASLPHYRFLRHTALSGQDVTGRRSYVNFMTFTNYSIYEHRYRIYAEDLWRYLLTYQPEGLEEWMERTEEWIEKWTIRIGKWLTELEELFVIYCNEHDRAELLESYWKLKERYKEHYATLEKHYRYYKEYYRVDLRKRFSYVEARIDYLYDRAEPYFPLVKPYSVNHYVQIALVSLGVLCAQKWMFRVFPWPRPHEYLDLSISDVDVFCYKDSDLDLHLWNLEEVDAWERIISRITFPIKRTFYKHGYYFKHIGYF
jgi:hypothetical protein